MAERVEVFTLQGDSPSGWKVAGDMADRTRVAVYVVGSEKQALWVKDALNTALMLEETAFERGG